MKYLYYCETPIGRLGIAETDGAVSRLLFDRADAPSGYELRETGILRRASSELLEYFGGARVKFDFPVLLEGTEFQKAAWNALVAIPFGETRSYRQIAEQIGCPKAFRAVGMANNRNPLPIIIPCHRVVGSDGSLTGYAGGLSIKQYLLDLEARRV